MGAGGGQGNKREGGMEGENVFGEIRMERRGGTAAHDCIAGDGVELVVQEEVCR